MSIEVRTRVAAEIYRGIDLPDNWVAHSTNITGGMARTLLVSVVVLLDDEQEAVAVCWEIPDHEEQFARCRFDDRADPAVLDRFAHDLASVTAPLGITAELLTTFLWEPRQLPRGQAVPIYMQHFSTVPSSTRYAWNMPERDIHANASDLIIMVRSIEDGLAEPVPLLPGDMQGASGNGRTEIFLMLPVKPGIVDSTARKTRGSGAPIVTLLFAAAMLVGIALYSAYLSGNF